MKKARFLVIAALALLSSTAFAEENYVAEVRNGSTVKGSYTTLEAALDAIKSTTNVDTVYIIGDGAKISTTRYLIENGEQMYINMNGHDIEITASNGGFGVYHGKLDISGNGTIKTNASLYQTNIITTRGNTTDSTTPYGYTEVNIGKDVTLDASNAFVCAVGITRPNPYHAAYGTLINCYGTVKVRDWYAFSTNGSLNVTTGNVPKINIEGANISATEADEAVFYTAGYAVWNITNSTIEGSTCIYAKAGTINIFNSKIKATGEYVELVEENGNGCQNTGDAIIMDAHSSYAGLMNLNISGSNTEVTSEDGYAIREVLTKSVSTHTIGVTISGGTFTGEEGAVKYSADLEQALRDGKSTGSWTVNGITGGTFSSDPIVCADNYYISNNGSTYGVKEFTGSPEVSNKAYITQDTEVQNLTINEDAAVIVKEDGENPVTLTVNNTVTVGEDENTISYITVQPGATLVAGNIVTYNNNSLRIESNLTNGTGVVLIDPDNDVTEIMGNVQFATNAKKVTDSYYNWQHFGIPTVGAPDSIKKNVQAALKDWSPTEGWYNNGGTKSLTAPFVGHEITVNSTETGSIFTFYGKLVGNADAKYTLLADGYSLLSNSYTAPMSIAAFVTAVVTPSILPAGTTDGMVWIDSDAHNDQFTKLNKASFIYFPEKIEVTEFDIMQGFFLKNNTSEDADFTIDYETAVFTPATEEKDASAANTGLITLSDGSRSTTLQVIEADNFSDDFEDGFDAEQNPAEQLQMYVVSGTHNLASLATNSIDGKIIEIKTTANTEYTLTFSQLGGYAYALTDISGATEKEVEVSEGGTYTFTAPANQTVQYFRLGEGTVDADEAEATDLNFWVSDNTLYVAGAESDIVVYNAAGVKVAAAKADGNAIQAVNIASLANGLYIVESGALTGKFIK